MNIARNKNLELSKNKHFMLQVDHEAINANGTKEEVSHSNSLSQQKYSLVTNNQRQRKKRKTYTEALKEDFRNDKKKNKEGVVSDKERNTGMRDNVYYVNKIMDCNKEDSSKFSKLKPIFFGNLLGSVIFWAN